MSGWSRSTKPSANTLIPAGDIYGVTSDEATATQGIAQSGWVHRKVVGTRVQYETLVAMKQGPTEAADDTQFPDFRVVFTTQPLSQTVAAPAGFTVSVVATTAPAGGTLSYQWSNSPDGVTFTPVGGATSASLVVADSTGLNNYRYRCAVAVTSGDTVNSGVATITVT